MPNIYFEPINKDVCHFAKPPSPSINARPDWWKDMGKYFHNDGTRLPKDLTHNLFATVRNCPGIDDTFNFGYTVYFPVDFYIDATDQDEIYCFAPDVDTSSISSTNLNIVEINSKIMMSSFKISNDFHPVSMKINSLWGIKTDPGYSIWISQPVHQNDLPFKIVDGIVDSDVYPLRFPISFFVRKNFKGVLKAGTPMYQVIPFKREDFVSHIVDLDKEEVDRIATIQPTRFTNSYKRLFWKRKKFL